MIGRSRRRNLAVGALLVGSIASAGLWSLQRRTAPAPSAKERDSTREPEPLPAMPVDSAASLPPAPPEVLLEAAAPASEEEASREVARLNVTDKPRALALALRADAAYPSTGVYAEARRAMIITLLVDLDRMEEARQRVYHYLDMYPGSPYIPLVEGKTGIHPRPQGPR
jgi:hypothetical protein